MTERTSQSVEQDSSYYGDGSEDFVTEVREKYLRARRHWGPWKRLAKKCYAYYAGRQWTEEEQTQLKASGKAPVVMNRIKPRVSAVVGMEISNRQELRYAPREEADEMLVSVLNKASEWTRDQAETEDHETEQFQDMVISGIGCSETVMDYEENPDGIAVTMRRSPLGYDWDSNATDANFTDAEHYFYSQDITRDQFEAMGFPISKARAGALGVQDLWEQQEEQPHDADRDKFYENEVPMAGGRDEYKRGQKVRLVRYHYIKRVKVWRVMMPDGSMRFTRPEKASEITAMMAARGLSVQFAEFEDDMPAGMQTVPEGPVLILPYVEQMEKEYRRAYFTGNELLEDKESPCPYGFTDSFMTGWRDETEGHFIGMVAGLIDPQEWSNKFLSQAIYIYTVNPKGGWIVKKRAVENPSEFESKIASPDAVQWARDDANLQNDFLPVKPGQYPPDLDKLTAFAIDSLPALDGLTPETMGLVSRDQPGILENMRKQASMAVLAPLFNAKRRHHKRQGKVLIHYISRYFSDAQLARIVGRPIPPEVLEALRSLDVRNYDVIVDDAPTSPNAKEYTLNILMEVLRQAPESAAKLMPLMIKNTPLDIETQGEIVKALTQNPLDTPEGQALQAQLQKLQQENMMFKAKAGIEMQKMMAETVMDSAKLDQKDDAQEEELDLERQKMRLDYDLEIRKLEQERDLKMMELATQREVARQKPANGGAE